MSGASDSKGTPSTEMGIFSSHRPPSILFHYCSLASFKAILESNTIRMGQLSSMNDYMEHSWLRHIALRRISDLKKQYPWSILAPVEENALQRFWSALETQLRTVQHVDPYCACFSEEGDVLSQWRAYADDGQGFAIGFASEVLAGFDQAPLRQVSYDVKQHTNLVNTLLQAGGNFAKTANQAELAEFVSDWHGGLLLPSMWSKNPKFTEEVEWRVIFEPRADTKSDFASGFRTRGAEILHYLELPLKPQADIRPLKKIMLGPKNPARNNPSGLGLFLASLGYADIEISVSEASYR